MIDRLVFTGSSFLPLTGEVGTTSSSQGIPPHSARNMRASSPTVMPWVTGSGRQPMKDWRSGSMIGPSTRRPVMGLGRSSTTTETPASPQASMARPRVEM